MIPKIILDKIYYYKWRFIMTKINIYYKEHIHRHNLHVNYTGNEKYYLLEKGYGMEYNWRYIEKGWSNKTIFNTRMKPREVGILPKKYVYSGID